MNLKCYGINVTSSFNIWKDFDPRWTRILFSARFFNICSTKIKRQSLETFGRKGKGKGWRWDGEKKDEESIFKGISILWSNFLAWKQEKKKQTFSSIKIRLSAQVTETLKQKNIGFYKFQKANGEPSDDSNLQLSSKSYLEKDHNQVAVELAA